MTEEELVSFQSVAKVQEKGWSVGFFKEGKPEGKIIKMGERVVTVSGEPVNFTDTIKLGIYRQAENPLRKSNPLREDLRARFMQ